MGSTADAASFRLDGQRALVTGGSRGIGQAIVERLLELGAEVLLVARDEARIARALEPWQARGLPVDGVAADVAAPDGRSRIEAALRERWDRLDILVNNAGSNLRRRFDAYADADQRGLV